MPEDEKESSILEFTETNAAQNITIDPADSNTVDNMKPMEEIEEAVGAKELKPFEWMGVTFPPYFQGPHFVEVKGSIVMAIDPANVSMEMKANWESKYRPELAALGKKVIEKYLNIKIETM